MVQYLYYHFLFMALQLFNTNTQRIRNIFNTIRNLKLKIKYWSQLRSRYAYSVGGNFCSIFWIYFMPRDDLVYDFYYRV